ncbi:NAD(P)-binding protein [Trichoderma citrinoviride]|uniref:NAD(P)-binding protein n=1 Tax=Trichoderma citrinoviride TaxID=58853 RepID=A0A2T4BBS8_9HYPO|nr:NAD(P)-binding protein [Trichoderma citrinoviride]PTB66793.1 NAD(P)-binding protein [Trichoderma citrinoviride]
MASPHNVLILGGHGKIAQLLTPLLLKRSWAVTSIIRKQDQVPAVERLGAGLPGRLSVLVRSIEDVDSQDKAASILDEVNPDYIAWSAGAGGKYGTEGTFRIDRDAAIHFINAAAARPSVTRFLLISYNGSRRKAAPWWSATEWEEYHNSVNLGPLATYYKAKLAADEVFYEVSKKSSTLVGIDLRPGRLTDEPKERVTLGKTKNVQGSISRVTVAHVADALLAAEGVKSGWLDLLQGDKEIDEAVDAVVREGVDTAEGEDIYSKYA